VSRPEGGFGVKVRINAVRGALFGVIEERRRKL
jgi:hypothetical protein